MLATHPTGSRPAGLTSAMQVAVAPVRSSHHPRVGGSSLADLCTFFDDRFLSLLGTGDSAAADRPLALVLIEIDHLPLVADICGIRVTLHLAGQVQSLVRETFPPPAVVHSHGLWTLAAVVPNPSGDALLRTLEELRVRIQDTPFDCSPGETPLNTTISAGIAIQPEDARGAQEIYIAAYSALYMAQDNGRNRVCAYRHVSPNHRQ